MQIVHSSVLMDSPKTTKSVDLPYSDTPNSSHRGQSGVSLTPKVNGNVETPKRNRRLYWTETISPKISSPCEIPDEFGWDDSPEPLKVDPKPRIIRRDTKRLSNIKGRAPPPRTLQPNVDTDNELATLQKVSSRLLASNRNGRTVSPSELPYPTPDEEDSELLVACTQSAENQLSKLDPKLDKSNERKSSVTSVNSGKVSDNSFERVLKSFCAEEDDEWLSQAALEPRPTAAKALFGKTKSSVQLESSPSVGFRRTSSFGPTEMVRSKPEIDIRSLERPFKKQKSFHADTVSAIPAHTLQEIERKRLEAKFRKDQLEIERKRQEALRRLRERNGKAPVPPRH